MFTCEEAELTAIGILLIAPKELRRVSGRLRPEHFGDKNLGAIYNAMLELDYSADGFDIAAILKRVGGTQAMRETLIRAGEIVAVTTTLPEHVRTIIDCYKFREAQRAVVKLGSGGSADEEIAALSQTLSDIVQNGSPDGVKGWPEVLQAARNTMFSPVPQNRIQLGIPSCDRILGGLDPTDYALIAARPSVGKTAFLNQVVLNLMAQGKRVLYISQEMPMQQIVERFTASLSNVELTKIRARVAAGGPEYDCEKDQMEAALEHMQGWKLDCCDDRSVSPAVLGRMIRSKVYDAIVIDHIGLMKADGKTNSREQEIASISRGLRMLAMKNRVQIIALCQLNRALEARGEKRVQLSDLRDSGSLEQDATAVMGLSRTGAGEILFEVLKNRNGKCGTQLLHFDGEHMTFTPIDKRYDERTKRRGME